jgi:predicted dehydrogenase
MNLNIILIGSGNYVLGDENKYGTIFPALLEFHKNKGIGSISILCNSFSSLKKAKRKIEKILQFIQTKPNIFYEINKDEKNIKKILLQRNINTAIVSVPDPFHYYYSKILLKNKINILVVKPLTNKIKESLELIKISKKNKTISFVEFHKRFDETNMLLKNKINEDAFGRILYFNINYSQNKNYPEKIFKKWSKKVNVFEYLGVHYVDLISYLTSYKPLEVTAWEQWGYLKNKGINTPDSIQAAIKWKNLREKKYFMSFINCSWVDSNNKPAVSDQNLLLVGSKGKFFSDQMNRGTQYLTDNEGYKIPNPYFTQRYLDSNNNYFYDGYGIKSILNFLNITNDKINNLKINLSSQPTFYNTHLTVETLEAINLSIKFNKKIKI